MPETPVVRFHIIVRRLGMRFSARKTVGAGAIALALFCGSTFEASAETKVKTTTTVTVVRLDQGGPVPDNCPFLGTGCTIVKTRTEETSQLTASGPGYLLTVPGVPMSIEVVRSGQTVSTTATNSSITFPSGSVFEIMSSTNYPSLVGTLINVTGIETNSLGGFSVFFIP